MRVPAGSSTLRLVSLSTSALVLLVALFAAVATDGRSSQTRQTVSSERGREIYLGITRDSGPTVKALIGNPPTEAPASLLSCAGCHGQDGRGKREGGVAASDITWHALTKPYGVTHQSGRNHPSYNERSLVRAISMGIDSAGNRLHVAMPRFQMSRDDMNSLIAYLKELGNEAEPGISDAEILVATVLPTTGPRAEEGRSVKALLDAYFEEANKQGGIYGRKFRLISFDPGTAESGSREHIERLIEEHRPFAFVAGMITGIESDVVQSCEKSRVPLIGPLTPLAETGASAERNVFYLLSGIEQQAIALVDYSKNHAVGAATSLTIAFSQSSASPELIAAVEQRCKRSRVVSTTVDLGKEPLNRLVENLSRSKSNTVLLLSSTQESIQFAYACEEIGWRPKLLIPGSLASSDLLNLAPSFKGQVYLAVPSVPADLSLAGVSEYRNLANNHRLQPVQIESQIAALCAAKVLTEGLKLTGRALTRERLLEVLERMYDYDTGLMPRIAFGPNRRIGALGAYIVTIDPETKQFKALSGWHRLD